MDTEAGVDMAAAERGDLVTSEAGERKPRPTLTGEEEGDPALADGDEAAERESGLAFAFGLGLAFPLALGLGWRPPRAPSS